MYILGLDIGGTKCAAVTGLWMNGEITILKKQSIETDHNISAYEMLSRIFDMADGILDKAPDAVGISCGGPLDSIRGVIMSPPNLPGWDNIEIVRLTVERFNSPAHRCQRLRSSRMEIRRRQRFFEHRLSYLRYRTRRGTYIKRTPL